MAMTNPNTTTFAGTAANNNSDQRQQQQQHYDHSAVDHGHVAASVAIAG